MAMAMASGIQHVMEPRLVPRSLREVTGPQWSVAKVHNPPCLGSHSRSQALHLPHVAYQAALYAGLVWTARRARRMPRTVTGALPYGIAVAGTGSVAPETVVSNDDLSEIMDTNDEWITQRTGIRRRHVMHSSESLASLSAKAAEKALEDADNFRAEDVDLVLHATSTPDDLFGTGPQVASMIGAKKAVAFDLTAACSGFVFALVTAAQYVPWVGVCVFFFPNIFSDFQPEICGR